jgi:hypothetical protein
MLRASNPKIQFLKIQVTMAIGYRFSTFGISMSQNIKGIKGYNSPSAFISIWSYRVQESKFNNYKEPNKNCTCHALKTSGCDI